MNRLPTEILLMIFRHIDDYRELIKLELVCRRWRQIMLKDGWKHLRRIQIEGPLEAHWIERFGNHCGGHLVECSFSGVDINSTLFRLIAKHFPALKHLDFRSYNLENLDANALEPFPEFGARLHSLSFYHMGGDYRISSNLMFYPSYQLLVHHIMRHFSRLRHLGFYLSYQHISFITLANRFFSDDIRSLYLSCRAEFSNFGLEQILRKVRREAPRLMALYLETTTIRESVLLRISELKGLRFLRIAFQDDFAGDEALCSCLDNLPKLIALQLTIPIQQLSSVLRSPSFRGLVHLSFFLHDNSFDNFESVGLLSTVTTQLRSLSLNIPGYSLKLNQQIGCVLLKIARNGILEHLHVPRASFTVEMLNQLIRDCPNLRSLVVQLQPNEPLIQVSKLHHVVADQWRAGTRKHVPLRIWLYCHPDTSWQCIDPFLTIQIAQYSFTPSNPVLEELFRDEVFYDKDSGGTPSLVTELYSKND